VNPPLRVALLLDPLSLTLGAKGLHVKWAGHAPELARELLGRGHQVRGFGAPPGLIPRSSGDEGLEEGGAPRGRLARFAPEVIVAYDSLSPAALRGARMARKLGSSLVLVESGWKGVMSWKDRGLRRVGERLWGRYVRRTSAGVVALDELAEKQCLDDGFPRDQVRIIPYGVDTQLYRPGLASPLVARHKIRGRILLFVGKLARERGVLELGAAFARTVGQRSDWNLVFAGDGPERPELRAMAERLGIGDRVFCLQPREEELPGLFGVATVLAFPALSNEVVGRYAARALACGLPLLASDLPRLRGYVEPEGNGLLFAPGSVEDLARAIQRLASSPTTRSRWARHSRKLAEERFAWPAVALGFEQLFVEASERVRARLRAGKRPSGNASDGALSARR